MDTHTTINRLNAALLALVFGTGSVLAIDGVWVTNAAGGNWDATGKWVDESIPGGAGSTADFQVSRTSGNINVALNGDRTVGILKLGFFSSSRGLTLTPSGKLILDNGASDAQINFRDDGGNTNINVATELNSNLLINNLDNGGDKGFFFTSGLSSTNGHLTITNTSNNNSRTKFPSVVSDGTAGNSISYNQTAGWSEFTAANTFTGSTTIQDGIIILGNSLALQNSALGISFNGTASTGLRIVGAGVTTLTLGGLTGDKNFAATGGVFSTASGNYSQVTALTLNPGTGVTNSYSGIIADGAPGMTLTKSGGGTQILSNAPTYSGNTTVSAGTLTQGAPNTSNESSTVTIAATGATYNLTFADTDTDTVDKLFIGANQQAVGVYGHTNSGATNGGLGVGAMNAYFGPGTGTLTVTTGPAGYGTWALAKGLDGTNNGTLQDPNNNGILNLMEYVLNGSPLLAESPQSILPTLDASGSNFVFTFTRRVDSAADTTQVFEYGSTLTAWTPLTIPAAAGSYGAIVVGSPTGTAPNQVQLVTITIAKAGNTKLFGRLQVTQP